MARNPATFDTFEEFRPPPPPIEGGDIDPRRFRRSEIDPYEEGRRYGHNRVRLTPALVQTHVKRWQSALLSKLSTIDGEIKELEKRKRSVLWFMGLIFGLLFGAVGFLIAIAVDYWLVADFWNTIFANEFGEVPANLATSPFVKALQVVVAALALHFLFQYLGRTGKRIFVYTMAFLAVVLLLGIGVWVANENLPPGFSMFGVQLTEDVVAEDTTLEDLGLAPPQSAPAEGADTAAADKTGSETLNNALGVMWFLAFGIIFLVVTGVAALSLGVAARAAAGLFGTLDREVYDGRAMNRQDVVFRLERALRARDSLTKGEYRLEILRAYLGDFVNGYMDGLGGRAANSPELMEALDEAVKEENAFVGVDMDDWYWVTDQQPGEHDDIHLRSREYEADGEGRKGGNGSAASSGNGQMPPEREQKPEHRPVP